MKRKSKQKLLCKNCGKEDYPEIQKEKRKKERNWKAYNEELKRRGAINIYISKESWDTELEKMNKNKVGRPFSYPNILIYLATVIRFLLHLQYRQEEGFLKELSQKFGAIPGVPIYTQLCRRINSVMKISKQKLIQKALNKWKKGGTILIDSTGIKVYNRSEWMRHKYKIKRGWFKLHIMVDKKGNLITAEVTEENKKDSEVFEENFTPLLKDLQVDKVVADSGYDTNRVFDAIAEYGAYPVVPPRDGAVPNCKSKMRRKVIREIMEIGYKSWIKKYGYGERWIGEGYFSTYKGLFGETVLSHKKENMINEIYTKLLLLEELKGK
jgi:transposase